MITIACMRWGSAFGVEYVEALRAGVARHLTRPHRFVCLTDETDDLGPAVERQPLLGRWPLAGNWPQMELFRPGRFAPGEPVLVLDLDTLVVGPLDPVLAAAPGAIDLRDWGWDREFWFGGAIVFRPEDVAHLWVEPDAVPSALRAFMDRRVPEGNIQDWMTLRGGWRPLPPALVRSYRYHSVGAPPPGASLICFHGRPKPHEIAGGWVPRAWRLGL